MAKKQITINIETKANLEKLVDVCKKIYGFDENEVFKMFIKNGFYNHADDFIDALYKGAEIEAKYIKQLPELIKIKKILKKDNVSADIANETLKPNVEKLKDEKVIEQIKNM